MSLQLHYKFEDPIIGSSENLAYTNGNIDWTIGSLSGTPVSRQTIQTNKIYQITCSGAGGPFRMYFNASKLINGETYNLSFKWRLISGEETFYINDWCDVSVSATRNTIDYGRYFFSSAYGSRTEYSSIYRFMDFVIGTDTVVQIWDLQLEQKNYPTPFTSTKHEGKVVFDSSGQKNHGNIVLSTAPVWKSEGIVGSGCAEFLGYDELLENYVQANVISVPWTTQYTDLSVGGWIYSYGPQSTNGASLVWKGETSGFSFEPIETTMRLNYGGAWSYINVARGGDNEWQHWMFTYENATTTVKVYKNGELVATKTDKAMVNSSHNYLWIGRRGGRLKHSFWGKIDDVRIYYNTLTPEEVKSLALNKSNILKVDRNYTSSNLFFQCEIEVFDTIGTYNWEVPSDVDKIEALIVAGGGGGGYRHAAGGGAGGYIYKKNIFVSPGSFIPITVGAGGSGATGISVRSTNGENSSLSSYIAYGGGGGGQWDSYRDGLNGGSGGGSAGGIAGLSVEGQGFPGGAGATSGSPYNWGGGGGAGQPGHDATLDSHGNGGNGIDFSSIFGESYGDNGWFCGGGGGGGGHDPRASFMGVGGLGGGGNGGDVLVNGTSQPGEDGMPNTGGGGGGAATYSSGSGRGGNGGSGIVIVRYNRKKMVL